MPRKTAHPRQHTSRELYQEMSLRLSEVNEIANALVDDSLEKLLKDATMGRGRKFGKPREKPIVNWREIIT